MVEPQKSERLPQLQVLRFVAASLVLFGHLLMEMREHGMGSATLSNMDAYPWGSGVDIFFVISGFIIFYVCVGKESTVDNLVDFISRRLIRIVPIYWFFSALMIVAIAMFGFYVKQKALDPGHIASSFLFIPWARPGDGDVRPILGQGWTLNYEMFFYAAFSLVFLAPKHLRGLIITAAFVVLVGLGALIHPQANSLLGFYTNDVVLEFVLGIGLCWTYLRFKAWPPAVCAILIVGGFVALGVLAPFWPAWPRVLVEGLPALLIATGFVMSGPVGAKLTSSATLILLGNASYSLYLSHPFIVNGWLLVWRKLHIHSPILFIVTCFALAVAVSAGVYVFLEMRIQRILLGAYAALRHRRALARPLEPDPVETAAEGRAEPAAPGHTA